MPNDLYCTSHLYCVLGKNIKRLWYNQTLDEHISKGFQSMGRNIVSNPLILCAQSELSVKTFHERKGILVNMLTRLFSSTQQIHTS